MFDQSKIDELSKKINEIHKKRATLTEDVDKEIYDLRIMLNREQVKKSEWEAAQKRASKRNAKASYMNILFKWDNHITFDTRRDKLVMFKDYVFAYGLPTSFEVKG